MVAPRRLPSWAAPGARRAPAPPVGDAERAGRAQRRPLRAARVKADRFVGDQVGRHGDNDLAADSVPREVSMRTLFPE